MRPDQENIARQLAATVLYSGDYRGRADEAGVGVVEVEMRGMVRSIRQQILIDQVSLAGKITDEIERQTRGVDLDAIVAKSVREEIARVKDSIPSLVRSAIAVAIEEQIRGATKVAAAAAVGKATDGIADKLYQYAYGKDYAK